jgi:hypothetical protein
MFLGNVGFYKNHTAPYPRRRHCLILTHFRSVKIKHLIEDVSWSSSGSNRRSGSYLNAAVSNSNYISCRIEEQ